MGGSDFFLTPVANTAEVTVSFTLISHKQAVPAAVMCERRYAISFLPLNFRLLAAEK